MPNSPIQRALENDFVVVTGTGAARRLLTVELHSEDKEKPVGQVCQLGASWGSSIYISFLLELRSSYFVIMIVFDASTLILIAKADLLDLFLTSINVPVAIPREVEKECCSSKKALDAIIIQKALDESRIEVFTLRNRRLVAKLRTDFSLGRGEAEAIALGLDEKAQIVGIDDKNGIDACKVLGIALTTAVGTLIRSREKGLLEKPDAIAKLALLAKYGRYKHSIIEDARLKLEAKP